MGIAVILRCAILVYTFTACKVFAATNDLGRLPDLTWITEGAFRVAVWSSAAPEDHISGLVAHYKFNEVGDSFDVADASGNGYNGVASSYASLITATGKLNGAFNMDGSVPNYVNVPYASAFDISATAWTIVAWVKPPIPSVYARQPIISQYDSWAFYVNDAGVLNFYNTFVDIATSVAVPYDEWHFVHCSFDGSQYVFSVDAGEVATYYEAAPTVTSGDLILGTDYRIPSDASNLIDDLRIYNRVLTQEEIEWLYASGSGTEEQ